ncbi:hypothetical protein GE061_019999 [Apolygus lucorum]|uniref:Uncharacterized protein n=1 Tax=Apolygus lucorum TaxID=248454 RepID=A0A8S9XE05_APOLU|nr:hypothetical protein GE061_019999 [Apolygus lucorum]
MVNYRLCCDAIRRILDFLTSSLWMDLVFMKMVFGNQSIQVIPEKFLASPGEFPYAVVILKEEEMFAGVLVTEDMILTSCKPLLDTLPPHISQSVFHSTAMLVIGSNGDWKNDPGRVKERSDFVYLGAYCFKITEEYQISLGATVLQRHFGKTPYIDSLQNRALIKDTVEWKTVIMKILQNAACSENVTNVCKKKEFVIGGYLFSKGKYSQDSPMFRVITHVLEEKDCYKIICKNISCGAFSVGKLRSTGTLCFPTKEIGGPGSPVTYGRVVVGVDILLEYLAGHIVPLGSRKFPTDDDLTIKREALNIS